MTDADMRAVVWILGAIDLDAAPQSVRDILRREFEKHPRVGEVMRVAAARLLGDS